MKECRTIAFTLTSDPSTSFFTQSSYVPPLLVKKRRLKQTKRLRTIETKKRKNHSACFKLPESKLALINKSLTPPWNIRIS